MKMIHNVLFRGILGALLGIVFIAWPELSLTYLVMLVGALFAAPGIISLITYYYRSKSDYEKDISIPIQGVASILLGLLLIIIPYFFIRFFMILLGIVLLIAASYQIFTLIRARKWGKVPWGFYILPVLLLTTGIVILLEPKAIASYSLIIFGVGLLIYGLGEILSWFKLRKRFN